MSAKYRTGDPVLFWFGTDPVRCRVFAVSKRTGGLTIVLEQGHLGYKEGSTIHCNPHEVTPASEVPSL